MWGFMWPMFSKKSAKITIDFWKTFQKSNASRFKMVSNWNILKNFVQITVKTQFWPFLKIFKYLKSFEIFNPPPNFTFDCVFKKQIFTGCGVLWHKKAHFVLLAPQGSVPSNISDRNNIVWAAPYFTLEGWCIMKFSWTHMYNTRVSYPIRKTVHKILLILLVQICTLMFSNGVLVYPYQRLQ